MDICRKYTLILQGIPHGETEFTKDSLVSIFNCIIFLKKIIDADTKEKFQRIVKREGLGLFCVLDSNSKKH